MIHELRMYTCKPGTAQRAVEASGTVGQRIRGGDTYGKLEGHFSSEVGRLNQYVHLWSYDDIADMHRKRSELAAREDWRTEFGPLIRPHLLDQTIRVLRPAVDMKSPGSEGNFYELRIYKLKVGNGAEFTKLMTAQLAAREKYSMNIGIWNTVMPDPNEVVHLWVYPSWEARQEARAGSQADPKWREFLGYAVDVIDTMESMFLIPSAWSPRK